MQQKGGPVREQRVALHFAESDAATGFPTLDRLVGQVVDGANGPHLDEEQKQINYKR